jgi:hypothetical protein
MPHRGRVGAISTRKIKTNMLAAVLILTVIPEAVQVGGAVIEHTCFLIVQKLLGNNEVSALIFSPTNLLKFFRRPSLRLNVPKP